MNQNVDILRTLRSCGFPMIRIRQAMFLLAGTNRAAIATKVGMSMSVVSQHISGIRTNQRVMDAIAEALDVPKDELFPDN
jgi:DNA-binding transcriptional regulator YdaS (Cro superfamily)